VLRRALRVAVFTSAHSGKAEVFKRETLSTIFKKMKGQLCR
jgi:hypothetical protein